MGGTNILSPLTHVVDRLSTENKQTRIFLLTDGQVSDPEAVIKKSRTNKDNLRVHTFGIGNGCDVEMVKKMAEAGRGSCSLVGDDVDNLNGLVVTALARASEPSLKGCTIKFGNFLNEKLGEVFRSQLLTYCRIIPRAEFEDLTLHFTCEKDPVTGQPIDFKYTSAHFDKVEEGFGLFKVAARELMVKQEPAWRIKTSIKY